jgi:hypothetical protein
MAEDAVALYGLVTACIVNERKAQDAYTGSFFCPGHGGSADTVLQKEEEAVDETPPKEEEEGDVVHNKWCEVPLFV